MARPVDIQLPTNPNISSAPECYARFFAFKKRDTIDGSVVARKEFKLQPFRKNADLVGILHESDLQEAMAVTPIDVDDDIVDCRVSKSKDRAAGVFEFTLSPGKVDYHAALHSGDHVLIWMKRNRSGKRYTKAYDSGFKMWGVVTNVRRTIVTNPGTGARHTRYIVSGEDFGHFLESDIYYNSILAEKLGHLGVLYATLGALLDLNAANPDTNVDTLLNHFLGANPKLGSIVPFQPVGAPNQAFRLPGEVTSFFTDSAKTDTMSSVLYRQIGVLDYNAGQDPVAKSKLNGFNFIQLDIGSKYTLWSTLQRYSNPVVNEMFADIRPIGPKRELQPTFVLRQIPYTSDDVQNTLTVKTTTFRELPRVKVPESFILSEDLARSDHYRFNYIQMFGNGFFRAGHPDSIVFQTQNGNFAIDTTSIARHGLRVMLPETDYDIALPNFNTSLSARFFKLKFDTFEDTNKLIAPNTTELVQSVNQNADNEIMSLVFEWVKLHADWFMRAHLLESGSFQCIGIEEPVGIGDNLEIARSSGRLELHHIQSYSHHFATASDGHKSFRTTFTTVRGQNEDGTPIYQKSDTTVGSNSTRTD